MIIFKRKILNIFLFLILIGPNGYSQPQIISITADLNPLQFGVFQADISVSATYTNPYDYSDVNVYAVIDHASVKDTVDAFWFQDYLRADTLHNLSPTGTPHFRLKYSPLITGTHSYKIYVIDNTGTDSSNVFSFNAQPSSYDGFLKKSNGNYLQFTSGKSFPVVGLNIAYTQTYFFPEMENHLAGMHANNSNTIRKWFSGPFYGLEWKNNEAIGNTVYNGLMQYNQKKAWELDWLLNECNQKNIYLLLTLLIHNEVLTTANGPQWQNNPYNSVNGGPCNTLIDYFTNQQAINYQQNLIRYVISRYGYSKNIIAWELENEINNTDNFYTDANVRSAVRSRGDSIIYEINKRDINKHLITTSYGGFNYWDVQQNLDVDSLRWISPKMDFTTYHRYDDYPYYTGEENFFYKFNHVTNKYISDFFKPALIGESGRSLFEDSQLSNSLDSTGIRVHNTINGTAFSGAMGTSLEWEWYGHILAKNLYFHYKQLNPVLTKYDLVGDNFKPTDSIEVTRGDGVRTIKIIPTAGGWTFPVNDTSFIIDSLGEIISDRNKLGIVLYGSLANTQFRAPPTFNINYPIDGSFKVSCAVSSGTANLTIYVDNILVYDQPAPTNHTATIPITAGVHFIRVDNSGSDWVNLNSFEFINAGNAAKASFLKSQDNTKFIGWIFNQNYNAINISNTGFPTVVKDAKLMVVAPVGLYDVTYTNTITGAIISKVQVNNSSGVVESSVPDLLWDAHISIEKIQTNVNNKRRNFVNGVIKLIQL